MSFTSKRAASKGMMEENLDRSVVPTGLESLSGNSPGTSCRATIAPSYGRQDADAHFTANGVARSVVIAADYYVTPDVAVRTKGLYRRGIQLAQGVKSHLRRGIAGWLIALLLLQAFPAAAQLRTTKPKKGPRAIGVVSWQANAQGKAIPRLLPVLIVEEGKFYDANLYRAQPRPMALDYGVVYEAQDKGDVLGYFTVKNALNSAPREWFGVGEFEAVASSASPELRDRTQTAELVKEVKPGENSAEKKTDKIFTESVDDRDIKKKTTVYDEEGKEVPAGQTDEDKPPTLKRKEGDIDRSPQVAPPKKETPKVDPAEEDAERPKLKRGSPAGTSTTAASPSAPAKAGAQTPASAPTPAGAAAGAAAGTAAKKTGDQDPNRPILRRGGSTQQKTGSEAEQDAGTPIPARVQARGDLTPVAKPGAGFATRVFQAVAVSDVEDTAGAAIRQNFRFRWTDGERDEFAAKLRKIAQEEAIKSLRASGQLAQSSSVPPARSATRTGAQSRTPQAVAPAVTLTDTQLLGLDLDANNSAELVYSAKAGLDGGRTLFVTLVARADVDGNPRKLFAQVATSDRLDVTSRLELVDAVDADGDGRGELLFRRVREHGADFILYRVGVDTLSELFHGGKAD
ncbi:MAG TPA: hypothetical protein VM009_06720 [Terriglobales bacterium]|nr:hypothetical protein [Terriglobales bacterium]